MCIWFRMPAPSSVVPGRSVALVGLRAQPCLVRADGKVTYRVLVACVSVRVRPNTHSTLFHWSLFDDSLPHSDGTCSLRLVASCQTGAAPEKSRGEGRNCHPTCPGYINVPGRHYITLVGAIEPPPVYYMYLLWDPLPVTTFVRVIVGRSGKLKLRVFELSLVRRAMAGRDLPGWRSNPLCSLSCAPTPPPLCNARHNGAEGM
ncbi:hypothetical protein BKA81DRAFT_401198 [Phyllosticta paracitricarpa]|uniref:Uncharacterized protein n=1 Tax=Phyllosticta citricarpa TaxID=55181 RepID=A0ABR1LBC0_9PEZI